MTILSDFIHIYDDFLTQEDHIDVFKTLCQPVWGYGHKSDTRNPFSFWNIEFCGIKDSYPTEEEYNTFKNNYPAIERLWKNILYKFNEKYIISEFNRSYANGHTFGNAGSIHKDDGDITFLYYSCPLWDPSWYGGTEFYTEDKMDIEKTATYRPNRLVAFSANKPHNAQAIARECDQLRSVIVFKSSIDVNSPFYQKYYQDLKGL